MIPDMSIPQCHGRLCMTEHAGDGRQRHAPGHGLARYGMAQVVKAHVFNPGFPARPKPEMEIVRERPGLVPGRGKDICTFRSRLSRDDGLRRLAQPHRARSRLRVRQPDPVPVDLRPSQPEDFALAAAGQQQQADDVGLWLARGPFLHQPVESAVKPGDLLR